MVKRWIERVEYVEDYEVDEQAKRKAMELYLRNMYKSIYDPDNIRQLKAFGWSEKRIQEYIQKELKEYEELKKKVESGWYDPKVVKYFARKGLIPARKIKRRVVKKTPLPDKPRVSESVRLWIKFHKRYGVYKPYRMMLNAKRNLKPARIVQKSNKVIKPKEVKTTVQAKPKKKARFDIKKVAFLALGAFIALKVLRR